jgi:hypothetical protein
LTELQWPLTQSYNSWTAISRGAVAKGLCNTVEDEIVTNVIAKYSYGILYNTPFDPAQHLDQDRYLCPYENIPKARNQVRWYLRKVRSRFANPKDQALTKE